MIDFKVLLLFCLWESRLCLVMCLLYINAAFYFPVGELQCLHILIHCFDARLTYTSIIISICP